MLCLILLAAVGAAPPVGADEAHDLILPHPGRLFAYLDQNGDGDVSRKEWLGSRQQFDKLDQDGDGLISLEEATRADRRR